MLRWTRGRAAAEALPVGSCLASTRHGGAGPRFALELGNNWLWCKRLGGNTHDQISPVRIGNPMFGSMGHWCGNPTTYGLWTAGPPDQRVSVGHPTWDGVAKWWWHRRDGFITTVFIENRWPGCQHCKVYWLILGVMVSDEGFGSRNTGEPIDGFRFCSPSNGANSMWTSCHLWGAHAVEFCAETSTASQTLALVLANVGSILTSPVFDEIKTARFTSSHHGHHV